MKASHPYRWVVDESESGVDSWINVAVPCVRYSLVVCVARCGLLHCLSKFCLIVHVH